MTALGPMDKWTLDETEAALSSRSWAPPWIRHGKRLADRLRRRHPDMSDLQIGMLMFDVATHFQGALRATDPPGEGPDVVELAIVLLAAAVDLTRLERREVLAEPGSES